MTIATPATRSAIVTVAMGRSTEQLDYTFTSFAAHNPGIPLHAFILGPQLPKRRVPGIEYHLVAPISDFSHPLREVYFRRHGLIDQLDVDHVVVVDSLDVLCLRPLPSFDSILRDFAMAACVENIGSRYILGQGYTSNFLNGGVTFWNLARSREIRAEILARGRRHFRTVADDQWVINEVVQTKNFDQLRILPCQFNFRPDFRIRRRNWPSVDTLDGVYLFHNATSMDLAKALPGTQAKASLPDLADDGGPLTAKQQFWRRLRTRLSKHIVG